MAIPAFPPSPMPRPNLTTEQARAEAAAADAARGLHGNLPSGVSDASPPAPPVGRAGTPRAGSRHADESMLSAGGLPSTPAAGAGTPTPSQPLSSPPPVTSVASGGDGGGTSSGDEGSSVGGWRARAALKAARLRQQADAAVKAATESLETLEVGAKVASAANAAAETAKQAQVRSHISARGQQQSEAYAATSSISAVPAAAAACMPAACCRRRRRRRHMHTCCCEFACAKCCFESPDPLRSILQEKAAKAFTEMTVSNEPGVNTLMATRDGEVRLLWLLHD